MPVPHTGADPVCEPAAANPLVEPADAAADADTDRMPQAATGLRDAGTHTDTNADTKADTDTQPDLPRLRFGLGRDYPDLTPGAAPESARPRR